MTDSILIGHTYWTTDRRNGERFRVKAKERLIVDKEGTSWWLCDAYSLVGGAYSLARKASELEET